MPWNLSDIHCRWTIDTNIQKGGGNLGEVPPKIIHVQKWADKAGGYIMRNNREIGRIRKKHREINREITREKTGNGQIQCEK